MKKLHLYTITLSLFLCSNIVLGLTQSEINSMKKNAVYNFTSEHYDAAYPLLDSLHTIIPNDNTVTYLLGICEIKVNTNYSLAINLFEAIKISSENNDIPVNLYLFLGDAYHFSYDFDNAIKNYKIYKNLLPKKEKILAIEVDRKIKTSTYANQLFFNQINYEKINLGTNINSANRDYGPVISADESTLIFTSRRKGGVSTGISPDGNLYEDIYISHKKTSGQWEQAELMSKEINTPLHDASCAITANGQNLFIYHTDKKNRDGEIYLSHLNGLEWGTPKPIGIKVNSKDWVSSISITPDEQTIYFVSNRKGGFGEKDIYVSHKMNNGLWGTATNLGSVVNSIYDEESPFIHPDGKTLFFSSKGHNTMGEYDVFKTVFNGTSWSTPENLGYPLNTVGYDLHFVLSANGKNGYYTSVSKEGYGKEDIYQIVMPEMNIPLTMIRGTILCADSLKPLEVEIKVKDVETNKFIKHVYRPNPKTGKYLIILPPGKNYDLIVSTKGYIPYKMNVFIPEQKEFYELYQTIYIKAVDPFNKKLGQGISIDNSFINTTGVILDLAEQKRLEDLRQENIQKMLNDIINKSDSLSLNNLNNIVETNLAETYNTINVNETFNSLLNLVNQIIENTDSTALKHIENIVERGFYTYAERNIFFYGDASSNLKDTIMVATKGFKIIQPLNYEDTTINQDSVDFAIGEKNEKFIDEKINNSSIVMADTILFDYKKAKIKKKYFSTIDQLISIYNTYPNMEFTITGYTDNIGSEEYNLGLSQKRGAELEHLLINKGVSKNKIITLWKGETSPIYLNNTEQGRAKNRRVEIQLIEAF